MEGKLKSSLKKKRKLGEGFLMLKLILKAGIGNRENTNSLFLDSSRTGISNDGITPSESVG